MLIPQQKIPEKIRMVSLMALKLLIESYFVEPGFGNF